MTRAGVEGGDESLEYGDGGEKDGKDARKENNDRDAKKDLKFALPPTMTSIYLGRCFSTRTEASEHHATA